MLATLATAVVSLLSAMSPLVASSTGVSAVINTLIQLIPVAVQEGLDITAPIKAIIAAMSANPAATADQLAVLTQLDAQVDAAFEAAAKDAGV